jgi:hypothetical protein
VGCKRIGLAVLVAGLGIGAAPAYATFHLNKVNEVMLASSGGDASVQFVEFLDRGGSEEQFTPVFGQYELVIYDAAGNRLGVHVLDPAGLRGAAAAGREYLVSTAAADAAFGVTGDERLDVSLPLPAGQACFEATTPSPSAFNCLTWGAISHPVPTNSQGSGSANGPVPPNGESDQRQPDDTIVAAIPTPKARNRGATPGSAGGPNMTAAPRFGGARLTARTASVDRLGRALVHVRCPAGTNGSCRGRITLGALRGRNTFGHASFSVPAARSRTVKVKLSHAFLMRLARARRVTVRARLSARDAAGTSKSSSTTLTIV